MPIPVLGGDVSVDVIAGPPTANKPGSNELGVFFNVNALFGAGIGSDISGGAVTAYDMADIADYGGWNLGVQGAGFSSVGGQAAWSFGTSPGINGKKTQVWHGGAGGGEELSVCGTVGHSFEIVEWNQNGVLILPRTPIEVNIPTSNKARYYPY
jgi:hypothetical protein